jgi:phosphatidylinositol alpha-mannosyltransferase
MKILMMGLTPPLEGGSEQHIYELSSRIPNAEVFTQKGSICKKKITVSLPAAPHLWRNILFLLASFCYSIILMCTPKRRYDLIHIHENLLYVLAPLLGLRYKVVITVHGLKGFKFHDSPYLWPLFRGCLSFADQLIAVSKADEKLLEKHFDNVRYMPNGVNVSLYQSTSAKIEKKITFIGRIHEQKGIIYLLRAFDTFSKKHPDVKLVLIGKINAYAEELQRQFPNPNIIWKGYVSDRQTIARMLKSSYFIALPSLWEGLPLTLFESLASGRPVLVSDIPAFTSVVSDKEVFFTKAKDARDIASKMDRAFANPALVTAMGKAGLAIARKYDWKTIATQLERLYADVLK